MIVSDLPEVRRDIRPLSERMLHPKKRCQECGGTEFKIHEGGEVCMSCGSCTYDGERPAEPPRKRGLAPGSEASRLNLLNLTTTAALSVLDQKIETVFSSETTRTRNEIKRTTESLIRSFYQTFSRDMQRLGLSEHAENSGTTETRCSGFLKVKNLEVVENLLVAVCIQLGKKKKDESLWRIPLGFRLQHRSPAKWSYSKRLQSLKHFDSETMSMCLKKALGKP